MSERANKIRQYGTFVNYFVLLILLSARSERIIVLQYNWRRVVVISSNYLLYWDAGKAIRKVFSESNITVAYTSAFNRFPSDNYIKKTLNKISFEGRSERRFPAIGYFLTEKNE